MPLLAELFSDVTTGVFAVEAEERIVFWNRACEREFGIPSQAAVGRACYDVVGARTLSGKPFCKPGCCLARLAGGGSAPPSFPLQLDTCTGQARKFAMRMILIPSQRRSLWSVAHVLCHETPAAIGGRSPQPAAATVPAAQHDDNPSHGLPTPAHALLTVRERCVLHLLAQGHGSVVISKQLFISHATVRNHIQNLIGKLGLHSQLEAVAYAHRNNLI